ncbi:MAG: DNA ligase D [Candidatus Saccharimonadales bacterium]
MGLGKYFSKRKFDHTPEPRGTVKKIPSKRLAFVVQEHHASQLHYDFRLEIDGVLKSWAIPKGPSMDPTEHRLAVHVEDHPYEYRTFEGVIPEGSYGAGNVIIWDEGYYEPRQGTSNPEAELRKELEKGHITFVLHGKKLLGEFALIKMHGDDEKAWLLVKKGDKYASDTDILGEDSSVETGRKVDELGAKNKLPDLSAYPPAKPWRVRPQLCTLVEEPFSKEGWLFEIKWDGYRAVGFKQGSDAALYSRADNDFSTHYPPVFEALLSLKHDVIFDGEITVIDNEGRPHFEWLQSWRTNPKGTLAYYIFDILWCDGHDLRTMPLRMRKQILQAIIPAKSVIRYSDHVETNGQVLFEQVQEQGLEGIVAKKADSEYRENVRGNEWLKIKTHLRQEVVIGGFTEPKGGRKYLGSLLVGLYEDGKFIYAGHSGGGIPDDQRKTLREKLDKLERQSSPFETEPKPNAPVHWVRPSIIAEMSFGEWTAEGMMRHPVFEGLRPDKKPEQVHRERPQPKAKPANAEIAHKQEHSMTATHVAQSTNGNQPVFSHLDKIFFPKHKYTKGDLIDYYRAVAPYILPYLKDRPLSLLRQPDGINGQAFFQKNNAHLPDWVPTADIYSDSNKGNLHWIVGGTVETLLYAVQLGSIEINPWNSRIKQLDNPDWIVIDLDPEGTITFKNVITVAQTVKVICDEWGVPSYPKTSGKTGIHIFIPMGAKYSYEQARNFAHLFAMEVNKREPKLTSIERTPAKRPNKIYIDFLQNREGQTLAAPYSVRPTTDACVSTPLHWDEVTPSLKPTDFTIRNMAKRLDKVGDLWKPVMGKGIDLPAVLRRISPE